MVDAVFGALQGSLSTLTGMPVAQMTAAFLAAACTPWL